MTTRNPYQAAADVLNAAERTLITTHVRPDGDAIGSSLALMGALRDAGRRADVLWLDELPPRYAFLTDGVDCRRWGHGFAAADLESYPVVCVLDTSAFRQLEPAADALRRCGARKLVLDHHQTRDPVGDVEVIDEASGSTAQMVLTLCRTAGWPLQPRTVEALLVGLATDTGWFRYSNTGAREFAAAAELASLGARPSDLFEKLYQNDPPARVMLIGRLLAGMQFAGGGRVAVLQLTRKLLSECGATMQMTEEIVNEPQRIGSVEVVVLCSEGDDGVVRVSLRSRRQVDVAKLAAGFGGGGHARAAGVRIRGTLEAVTRQVVDAVVADLAPHDAGDA